MVGIATYRGNTADYEQSHAYITDRRNLESQDNADSEWGPVKARCTRAEVAAVTPMGDVNEAGLDYLSHLWTPAVLQSTDESKETCPFPFISYILPTTRSRGTMTNRTTASQNNVRQL